LRATTKAAPLRAVPPLMVRTPANSNGLPKKVFDDLRAPFSATLLKRGKLKTYKDFPHGMPTTQAQTINADLLAFIKS
jgi:hypothetical protein